MRRLRPLQVPDCPGAEMLIRRLVEVFAPAQPPLDRLVVADARQAAQLGMTGSPTLLVDGVDPFGAPGTPIGLSCRLYRDEHGGLGNSPSSRQLRAALAMEEDAAPIRQGRLTTQQASIYLDRCGHGGR
jgi:hypothetical protein